MDAEGFAEDVRLIFRSYYRVFGRESTESDMVSRLESLFETQMLRLPRSLDDWPADVVGAGLDSDGENDIRCIARNRPRRAIRPPAPPPRRFSAETQAAPRTPPTDERLKFCSTVLRELRKSEHKAFAWPFLWPVNVEVQGCPDYLDVIKNPMDVSKIGANLAAGEYQSHTQFEEDMNLIVQNCYTYNEPGDPIYERGKRFEALFRRLWAKVPSPESESSEDLANRRNLRTKPQQTMRWKQQAKKLKANPKPGPEQPQRDAQPRRASVRKRPTGDSDSDFEASDAASKFAAPTPTRRRNDRI
ncbi:MAG: Bromodomain-containing protein [Olpidium bornovanus]|uniref:Bromodomain-containing protein n=1 Tax=Olpidium bornovanus TaxID=278681 RepID=A0A8H7ZMT7_9FUNG|nr:MAG: Bromodomain-containing protein [Olpidium bornovanus]